MTELMKATSQTKRSPERYRKASEYPTSGVPWRLTALVAGLMTPAFLYHQLLASANGNQSGALAIAVIGMAFTLGSLQRTGFRTANNKARQNTLPASPPTATVVRVSYLLALLSSLAGLSFIYLTDSTSLLYLLIPLALLGGSVGLVITRLLQAERFGALQLSIPILAGVALGLTLSLLSGALSVPISLLAATIALALARNLPAGGAPTASVSSWKFKYSLALSVLCLIILSLALSRKENSVIKRLSNSKTEVTTQSLWFHPGLKSLQLQKREAEQNTRLTLLSASGREFSFKLPAADKSSQGGSKHYSPDVATEIQYLAGKIIPNPKILTIGSAAAYEAQVYRKLGAASVVAVSRNNGLNKAIKTLSTTPDNNSTFVSMTGRVFLEGSRTRFDVIHLSEAFPPGADATLPTTHTAEMYEASLRHLRPGGLLTFSCRVGPTGWPEALRQLITCCQALRRRGIQKASEHIVLLLDSKISGGITRQVTTLTFLLSAEPLTSALLESLDSLAHHNKHTLLALPSQSVYPALTGMFDSEASESLRSLFGLDCGPVTDNSPYLAIKPEIFLSPVSPVMAAPDPGLLLTSSLAGPLADIFYPSGVGPADSFRQTLTNASLICFPLLLTLVLVSRRRKFTHGQTGYYRWIIGVSLSGFILILTAVVTTLERFALASALSLGSFWLLALLGIAVGFWLGDHFHQSYFSAERTRKDHILLAVLLILVAVASALVLPGAINAFSTFHEPAIRVLAVLLSLPPALVFGAFLQRTFRSQALKSSSTSQITAIVALSLSAGLAFSVLAPAFIGFEATALFGVFLLIGGAALTSVRHRDFSSGQ